MIRKITAVTMLFVVFFYTTMIHAKGPKYAEIFDPRQDKVVKVVQMNTQIYHLVACWIKDIDGIYGNIDPVTDDGYAVRIPLDPAVEVHVKWLNAYVDEIYIIIPENDLPFFMIFENESKLTCFPFTGDVDRLSKVLNFELRSS